MTYWIKMFILSKKKKITVFAVAHEVLYLSNLRVFPF